jgi:hypothetical protein
VVTSTAAPTPAGSTRGDSADAAVTP